MGHMPLAIQGGIMRKTVVLATLILGWVLVVGASAAETPAEGAPVLSLSQAIQTALKENPRITAARSRVDASQARITQARAGLLPQVFFSETYNRTNNPMWAFGTKLNQEAIAAADFNPALLNDPESIDNFASNLTVAWPLFDSGQTWFGWRQAKLGGKEATHGLARARQQAIARTVFAYYGLLLAQKHLEVVEQSLKTARVHLQMVQSRYDSGFVVKSDLLRAQVHAADLEQQRLQAETRCEVALAVLNAAMGVAVDSRFELVSPLVAGEAVSGSLADWTATALAQRDDYKQIQGRESIAAAEISKSRAAHFPSFNLVGNYELNSEDFGGQAENYTLGAVLRLNLFSGQRLSAKTREAQAAFAEMSAVRQEMAQNIRVETRQAHLEAQSAWKRIEVAHTALSQAEEALRIVRNRYNSGLLTVVELLDAEVALQQARTNHFKSLHDYKIALAALFLAAGTLDENFN